MLGQRWGRPAILACVLAIIGVVSSARLVPDVDGTGSLLIAGRVDDTQSMLVSSVLPQDDLSRDDRDRGHDDEKHRAYVAVKYFVPPHSSDKFEDEWEVLQKKTYKEYDEVVFFGLRKPKFDNTIYYGYSEWESMRHAQHHHDSKMFREFADFLDDEGIKWELYVLENLSEDIEEQGKHGGDDVATATDALNRRRHHGEQPEQPEDDDYREVDFLGELQRRRSRDDDKHGQQDQQGGADDWDKNIPEDQRHYIPDQYRPKHKDSSSCHCKHCHCDGKGGRRAELGAAALATLGAGATDTQVTEVYTAIQKRKKWNNAVHVLIHYYVPPHVRDEFVDEWSKAAEETIKEKGNLVYSLRRVLSNNNKLWIYGVWDSWQSYTDHFESKHVGSLRDYAAQNDIIWFIQPMSVVGKDETDEKRQ